MERIIILGSGIAGSTAAIYAARAGLQPLVISGTTPGGLLTRTNDIENFPGFTNGITGVELMEKLREQAERFGARFQLSSAKSVDLKEDGNGKTVTLSDGQELRCLALIAATGAEPRWLGLPREQELLGRGISVCATCDGVFLRGKTAAVVGGGDSAATYVLELAKIAKEVHWIHRSDKFTAGKILLDRISEQKNVWIHTNTQVTAYRGEPFLTGVYLTTEEDNRKKRWELDCDGLFLALGYVAGTSIFQGQVELCGDGCIAIREPTAKTSVDGFFAAGDCADCTYRQAVTAAASGCRAAMDAQAWLEKAGVII